MNKVIHFELPADNIERAKKFYKETFDWEIKDIPEMNYSTVLTAEVGGAINGGMFKRQDADNLVTSPTFAIDVEDIEQAIKKIKNAGGLILKDKMQIGDMGLVAYFKDTEGNILSVWQNTKK